MKAYFFSILLLYAIFGFAQGVSFYNGTWEDALAEAKENNKYIFVDAYTDWCYWCKVMDKETFPNDEVGKFYEENFIAYKMDMEKGIGIKLSQKYRVSGFPSFLYFKPNGKLVYKSFGYEEPEAFITTAKRALDEKYQMNYPTALEDLDLAFPEFYTLSFIGGEKRLVYPS